MIILCHPELQKACLQGHCHRKDAWMVWIISQIERVCCKLQGDHHNIKVLRAQVGMISDNLTCHTQRAQPAASQSKQPYSICNMLFFIQATSLGHIFSAMNYTLVSATICFFHFLWDNGINYQLLMLCNRDLCCGLVATQRDPGAQSWRKLGYSYSSYILCGVESSLYTVSCMPDPCVLSPAFRGDMAVNLDKGCHRERIISL